MLSRSQQPIRDKLLQDQKKNNLSYEPRYNSVERKTVLDVPDFRKKTSRRALLPGMNICSVDPTGVGFIDETRLGTEGEGYGLASFKKGLQSISTCNILKANSAQIALKEHRSFEQVPFDKVLGRS